MPKFINDSRWTRTPESRLAVRSRNREYPDNISIGSMPHPYPHLLCTMNTSLKIIELQLSKQAYVVFRTGFNTRNINNVFSPIDIIHSPVIAVYNVEFLDATYVTSSNCTSPMWIPFIILLEGICDILATHAFQRATEIIIRQESVSVHRASLAGP